jgi:ribosomal protein L24E
MADQWYYEHETTKRGPFSAHQLRELAAEGRIGLTDIIWKEGVGRGLIASKVKNLFAPAHLATLPPSPSLATQDHAALGEPAPPEGATSVPNAAAVTPVPPEPAPKQVRQARAVAGRGIVLISQDGVTVWFKKKCFVCGFEDSMRGKMMIKRGSNRMSFLCAKCRKMREAEFQGIL